MPVSKFSAAADAQGPFPRFPPPWWHAPGAALYLGNAVDVLKRMPARSVHCVISSPPYWGLRDYGTGTWEGGDAGCDHIERTAKASSRSTLQGVLTSMKPGNKVNAAQEIDDIQYRGTCSKCGAVRTDMQIGAEPSPDCGTHGRAQCGGCFVCSMVGVFREVRHVLRDDGTCWLNLGDSYCGGASGQNGTGPTTTMGSPDRGANQRGKRDAYKGLASGNLVGIPWRVALALQADEWVLRSDVPWVKRSAMPESVENRPCKSLEYVFLLAKAEGYYFDMDAVRPASLGAGGGACFGRTSDPDGAKDAGAPAPREYDRPEYTDRAFRNNDLWFQSVDGPHGAVGVGDELVGLDVTASTPKVGKKLHFAVFPQKLITPLILASTSEHGCCAACGRPWERVVNRTEAVKQEGDAGPERDRSFRSSRNGVDSTLDSGIARRETVGWRKACGCRTDEVVPAVVLDPFVGSGTTVATAIALGRAGVGIDLSEAYLRENAVPRIEAAISGGKAVRPTAACPADVPPAPRRMR